ncbi:hypothetical protein [Aeromonas cavernicola]|uniref:hypothetical protein n=1 Tax=Aeromonas cavernicola TaxID=1006623 RepID=UPI001F48A434|nr:hypothetical protein [Aeromonas cavernicola]
MKKLSQAISAEMSQGRRNFLTHSSIALISLAASAVLPTPVLAAVNAVTFASEPSFDRLNNINFYVSRSELKNIALGRVDFQQPTDEAQYLAQVLFQELMKYCFLLNNSGLSQQLGSGMMPDMTLVYLNDGYDMPFSVFVQNKEYFEKIWLSILVGYCKNHTAPMKM